MVTLQEVEAWALALPEAEQQPHFEKASFRVKKKIFATLDSAKKKAVVKLSAVDQSVSRNMIRPLFIPCQGRGADKDGRPSSSIKFVRRCLKTRCIRRMPTLHQKPWPNR